MDVPWWPVWGIRIRTPRLEMRPVREAEVIDLVELAAHGVHDPATMPFSVPWTDLPSPQRERSSLAFHARNWAELSPRSWRLAFAAYADGGGCIGTADLGSQEPGVTRTVTSGSWVGLAHQRRGLGSEMRAGLLRLAFEHLGMERACTEAWHDNEASLRLTQAFGYRPNGETTAVRRNRSDRLLRFVMERADWESSPARDVEVTVEGVTGDVLGQLGL